MGYEMDNDLVEVVFNQLVKNVQVLSQEVLCDELDADHVLEGMTWLLILFNEWTRSKQLLGEEFFEEIHHLFELVGEEDPVTIKSIEEIVDDLDQSKTLFKRLVRCKQLSEEMDKKEEFNVITQNIYDLLEVNQYIAVCYREYALEKALEIGDQVAISSYESLLNMYTTFRGLFKEIASKHMDFFYYADCLINEEWDYRAFSLMNVKGYGKKVSELWQDL